ncbi:EF-hand domain-containing protein [Nonomuraea sp. NPDC005692]|uniref:EF-hand domain-containing protein n=1 Tax=Nonomuraea sp. NPDC005692 TaxID=3157168 RepID=UPI0033E6C288
MSEVLARKLKRAFDHLDANGDGLVARSDLDALGTRLLEELGEAPSSAKAQRFAERMEVFWQELAAGFDADRDGQITMEEFRAGMTAAFVTRSDGYARIFRPAIEALIAMMDVDGDGVLSSAEFARLQRAFGTSEHDIALAFEQLDTDQDGRLSAAELDAAIEDFYTGSDAGGRGAWLFGPM